MKLKLNGTGELSLFHMWFGIANRAYLGLLILIGLIPWIGWIFGIVMDDRFWF